MDPSLPLCGAQTVCALDLFKLRILNIVIKCILNLKVKFKILVIFKCVWIFKCFKFEIILKFGFSKLFWKVLNFKICEFWTFSNLFERVLENSKFEMKFKILIFQNLILEN